MLQSTLRSSLDNRSVGHRIAERDAEFNYRSSGISQFDQEFAGGFQIGITRHYEGNEALLPFPLELGEYLRDATQYTNPDSQMATLKLINIRVKIADSIDVFISAAREIDNHDLIRRHFSSDFDCMSDRMGRLERGDNAL